MQKYKVAKVKYQKPFESVKRAVDLSLGLDKLSRGSRVFIKPNIVFWTKECVFPKWGVITTSRVVLDIVKLLKDMGIDDITIGEGIVTASPKDKDTPADAFKSLGYEYLKNRYGVKYINIMERPFKETKLLKDTTLYFNKDIIESDFVINLPVMKTHTQTKVSLGIKNLKGTINIPSRKKCHSPDPEKNLHFMVSLLADKMPPIFTMIDGIYTLEKGPSIDGIPRRSNILIASDDILSADMTAAKQLGYNPCDVYHIANAAEHRNRPTDLSDVEIVGDNIESVYHKYDFKYVEYEKGYFLPEPLVKDKITGLSYPKYDSSMCTYCSFMNGLILSAIRYAWKGEPWDKVEILTGKAMKPSAGKNKTVLIGKCMCQANKDHPNIKQMIPAKGCPPDKKKVVEALHQAGIEVDPLIFEKAETLPALFMERYKNRPEFEEDFFTIHERPLLERP